MPVLNVFHIFYMPYTNNTKYVLYKHLLHVYILNMSLHTQTHTHTHIYIHITDICANIHNGLLVPPGLCDYVIALKIA